MISYYINPKTRALIIHDPENNELFITERIEKVRVMTGAEIRLGDFEGTNRGAAPDEYDEKGGYTNSILNPGPKAKKAKGTRTCKTCGKVGHNSKTCSKNASDPAEAQS